MRRFGRFELRALLGKSTRSMLWLVWDPRAEQELLVSMPRAAPEGTAAMERWLATANGVARVKHPHVAPVLEVGRVEQWPYVAYERSLGETLEERLSKQRSTLPLDAADWLSQFLQGLAFAHEAGHVHRDIQTTSLIINAANQVCVLGLDVALESWDQGGEGTTLTRAGVRDAIEGDLLCTGLLLHRLLSAKLVLDQHDFQAVVNLMQPHGHELVRLAWETPYPIPDPLRAIANRATDRQVRQRYHTARSFQRALEGWRAAAQNDQGGPIVLLLDKLQRVGHLPSTTTMMHRITQSSTFATQHTNQMSTMVLQDMALSLELLRRVNHAMKQSGAPSGGTVLTMQRSIAMLGLNGLEQAARVLKPWPGPLGEVPAAMLGSLMKRVRKAGQVAQALRPAGYDGEVVYLITVLQNLGRLLLQYHFPEDAQQVRQLMQPPEPTEDNPNPAGMNEQAAAYAVLGCDLESLGNAVARYWGLGDDVLQMMRRQPPETPVRHADSDVELLRLTCSLANEVVDAQLLPETKRQAGVEIASKRYARVLGLHLQDVQLALNAADGKQAPEPVRAAVPSAEAAASVDAPNLEKPLRDRLRNRSQTAAPGEGSGAGVIPPFSDRQG